MKVRIFGDLLHGKQILTISTSTSLPLVSGELIVSVKLLLAHDSVTHDQSDSSISADLSVSPSRG